MSERDARGPEDHDAQLEWRAPSNGTHVLGPWREPVAEGTGRRAAHDRLGTLEAHLAFAHRGNVEIRLADQQRTEVGFAQRAEEVGEAAARHIDIQRFLVVSPGFDLDLPAGDLAEDALYGRPLAPRAALDALT